MTTVQTHHPSPLGPLWLVAQAEGLLLIEFPDSRHAATAQPHWQALPRAVDDPLLSETARQLDAYFAGKLQHFDLPLAPGMASGTAFQQRVWQALQAIPYGATFSYRDIAQAIGQPKAVRAVGAANGRNPLPIVVPCHRVVGADGSLTGFGGGLPAKQMLLRLEGGGLV